MAYVAGQLFVAARLVFADETRDLESGHLFHGQDLQDPIGGIRLRDGAEAAAVKPAIADTDHGHIPVQNLSVDFQPQVLGNPPDHVDHRRSAVGPEPLQQREPLVAGHIRADTGIQAHGADVQAQVIVAADQVQLHFFQIQEPPQIPEGLWLGEEPDKVIAAAPCQNGDSGICIACRPGSHLVQGAVSPAGVDAVVLPALRRLPGQPEAIPRPLRDLHPIVKALAAFQDLAGHGLGPVIASRRRIDEEEMFHFLFFLWLFRYI